MLQFGELDWFGVFCGFGFFWVFFMTRGSLVIGVGIGVVDDGERDVILATDVILFKSVYFFDTAFQIWFHTLVLFYVGGAAMSKLSVHDVLILILILIFILIFITNINIFVPTQKNIRLSLPFINFLT